MPENFAVCSLQLLTAVSRTFLISTSRRPFTAMPPKRKAAAPGASAAGKQGKKVVDQAGESGDPLDSSATTTTETESAVTESNGASASTTETTESQVEPSPAKKAKGRAGKAPVNTFDYYADATAHDKCKDPPAITIASWNVAGLRAWLKKPTSGLNYLKETLPDILCLQEIKAEPKDIPLEAKAVTGYKCYWSPCTSGKKGYSGVGLYTKVKPESVTYGMGIAEHDTEGRVITAEYKDFYLVCAYVPNSGQGLKRLEYRGRWDSDFASYLKKLDAKKPVIYTGDLNVAHLEYDIANPDSNRNKSAGFTDQERQAFTELLDAGFVDSFRHLYPHDTKKYTYWSFRFNCRAKNVGWRLDYFLVSKRIADRIVDSRIDKQWDQSDHSPLVLQMASLE